MTDKNPSSKGHMEIVAAVSLVLRAHFTGVGAAQRRIGFVMQSLKWGALFSGALMAMISVVLVTTVTVGFGHVQALTEFHSWTSNLTSVDLVNFVSLQTQLFSSLCMISGLTLGVAWQFLSVIEPAIRPARFRRAGPEPAHR